MRKIFQPAALCIVAALMIICCSAVREHYIDPVSAVAEQSSFMEVDSLILFGSFQNASDSLLSMLGRGGIPDASVLFRLCGLYSVHALEDECISILDSLESEGYEPLYGWKVSILGLEGRYDEALQYIPTADTALMSWVIAEINSQSSNAGLPDSGDLQQDLPVYLPADWESADSIINSMNAVCTTFVFDEGSSCIRAGLEMAVLLNNGDYNELISLCDSISTVDAPRFLKARAGFFKCSALSGSGVSAAIRYAANYAFSQEYPDHPEARKLAYQVGKYHDNEHEWLAASDAYLYSLKCSGSYEGDERCYWRGGFCAYMSGNYELADSLWSDGCRRWEYGYWYDEMKFWRARIAEENGNTELAQELLTELAIERPWEFYGMLASQRIGLEQSLEFRIPVTDPLDYSESALAVSLMEQGYGIQALEVLSESMSPDRVAPALALMGKYGECLYELRQLDSGLRDSNAGILPDSLLIYYFPAPVLDLADIASDSLEINSNMLISIMRSESRFNCDVISSAGARGIIQLMPGTAYDIARWWNLPQLSLEELHNPALSIPYATLYINKQLRKYDADEPLYLAAYNAGPGNSDRWIDMHGWNPDDPELWIEQVTYRETRMYVKKVLRTYWLMEIVFK